MLYLLIAGSLLAVFVEPACNVPNGIEETSANFILGKHNLMRSLIAKGIYSIKDTKLPSASNMRKMEWSCDLQKQAQEVVDKSVNCIIQDQPTGAKPGYTSVIVSSKSPQYSDKALVIRENLQIWEKEVINGGWQLLNSSKSISHGTQMLWWSSNKIGCAIRYCYVNEWLDKVCQPSERCDHVTAFTCVYSPGGNIRGQPAYVSGAPCSNCGDGFKCEATSKLCVPA